MLKVIDNSLALDLTGGSQELADELLTMLVRDLPQLRSGLIDAYRAQRIAELRALAHKLNGATRYCGVPALSAAANELETLLKQGVVSGLEGPVDDVTAQIDRLLSAAGPR